jgi:hypothetical protein
VPQGVHGHMLAQTGRDASRTASGVQNGWSMIFSENRFPLFGIML